MRKENPKPKVRINQIEDEHIYELVNLLINLSGWIWFFIDSNLKKN